MIHEIIQQIMKMQICASSVVVLLCSFPHDLLFSPNQVVGNFFQPQDKIVMIVPLEKCLSSIDASSLVPLLLTITP